jgi:hypothetical protein
MCLDAAAGREEREREKEKERKEDQNCAMDNKSIAPNGNANPIHVPAKVALKSPTRDIM